ncbi:MAG TPA: 50S ribosomal protein L20 [Candidatus Azoamicus sp. OHIO1]
MSRVKRGITARRKHKKILKQAKGYYGARSRVFRTAKQSVIKAHQYAYRDRKCKKREFRALWIIRINSALKKYNIAYNEFIYKLKKLNININRKILSELILNNMKVFDSMVERVKNYSI